MGTGTTKAVFAILLVLAGADFLAVNLVAGPAWIAGNSPPPIPSAQPDPPPSGVAIAPPATASSEPRPAAANSGPQPPPDAAIEAAAASSTAPAGSSAAPTAEVFATIQFTRNSTTIRADCVEPLRRVVKEMKANPELRPRFEGHADEPGDKAVQDFLSLQRARMARSFVGSSGVDPGRISVEGFGSTRKLDPSGTEQAGARNRRVEIILK